mgnify:CR=1 FL=1
MSTKSIKIKGRSILAHSNGSITFYSLMTGDCNTFGYINGNGYKTWGSEGSRYLVHRIIAEAFLSDWNGDMQVDHIDGNKSNNDFSNLRMVTAAMNQRSYRKNSGVSKYRGVCLDQNRWKASCRVNGKKKHIGSYGDEKEAAIARDAFVFSVGYNLEGLNFPENHTFGDK